MSTLQLTSGVEESQKPVEAARPSGRWLRRLLSSKKARFGAALLVAFVVVAIFAPLIAPDNPSATNFVANLPVSRAHLLGTSSLGQDLFSQLIWGTRPSLIMAFAGGLGTTLIALFFGSASAYFGGRIDRALSLVTDIFLVLPGLPLMIVITAYAPHSGIWLLVAVIIITGWAFGARQLRAQALSVNRRGYVEAARARGERDSYIIALEVIPTMIPLLAATFLGAALYAVLAAAGLQFLGLGGVSTISWGTMLYAAQNNEALSSGQVLWAIAPGACVGLLGAAFAFLNYGFDEIANPALGGRRRKRNRTHG